MKKAIKALWHGIKAVFTAVVEWMATFFGMKENTKYGHVLRGIVGTAFAVLSIFLAASGIVCFLDNINIDVCKWFDGEDDVAYTGTPITDNIIFYDDYCNGHGYLANANGKKLIKQVSWIAKPINGDSLACYSDGGLRGYFHISDGHVVVKPTYTHAWIFSDGLAAVSSDGQHVKFINPKGEVVIDRGLMYDSEDDGYVFHNGHCAVNDSTGNHMGLIDRNGEWVLPPIYSCIVPKDTFWLITQDDKQAVLTFDMDTVIPLMAASLSIYDTVIEVTFADHTKGLYNLQGELIRANLIERVTQLMYTTREVVYDKNRNYNDEYEDEDYYLRKEVAKCRRYETEYGWCGLMSPDGKLITPPSYCDIEAIDKDLYLCKTSWSCGILLNSKGQRVEQPMDATMLQNIRHNSGNRAY